ncbi:MAG: hypothetical protein KKE17_09605 [Proteobacteria bacterium]|nr:hypothetical protein [Pseudomonadota bacterium]MBU1710246.1 hypothetical protein [Pseudomonadota bacterium]
MRFIFLFSSPNGDIPVDQQHRTRPLILNPGETHPCLTLGDYFKTLAAFIQQNLDIILSELKPSLAMADIQTIFLRTEKHGALYHIASAEIVSPSTREKFAISSAITAQGKETLIRDTAVLESLGETHGPSFIPRIYCKGSLDCGSQQQTEILNLVASEWFEDYHEWHLTADGEAIKIWDNTKGNRIATEGEQTEIFRQVALILTVYYDFNTGKQIHPWHHAAGDFIIRDNNGTTAVKLTTARDYRQIIELENDSPHFPLLSLLIFFLHLTVRTRLDKVEGTDQAVWAGNFSVTATLRGFIEGIRMHESLRRSLPYSSQEIIGILQSYTASDFSAIIQPLMDVYLAENPREHQFISRHLENHLAEVCGEIARL